MFNHFKIIKLFNSFDKRILYPKEYSQKFIFIEGHDEGILSLYLALNFSSV